MSNTLDEALMDIIDKSKSLKSSVVQARRRYSHSKELDEYLEYMQIALGTFVMDLVRDINV